LLPLRWGWHLPALATTALVLLPLLAIVLTSLGGSGSTWPHLAQTVLPGAALQTFALLAAVTGLSLCVAAPAAWLVTAYDFPGSGVLRWALILPLAIPTYIMAYVYAELLDFPGPLQTLLRDMTGWQSRRDYWFPEIRSFWGAVFILSLALYPYVFLAARAAFRLQSASVIDAARTLGRSGYAIFFRAALPLARPALAAGLMLVAMECLNDIGAVQFLGIRTLTASIYDTWLHRSDMAGAAQLSLVLLGFIITLLLLERAMRGGRRYAASTRSPAAFTARRLAGGKAFAASFLCFVPVLAGFILPVAFLLEKAPVFFTQALDAGFAAALGNSLLLASLAGIFTVAAALLLAGAQRLAHSARFLSRLATTGYAVPGTIIALGIMAPLAAFDNAIDAVMRERFGVPTGLIFSGSLFALVFAYGVRFLAVAFNILDAGYQKLSPNLDAAAQALGSGTFRVFARIHVPLLRPALFAALLTVFVDSLKELPATLLLRPFNFETLATATYSLASLEQINQSSPFALAIVAAGLLPVLLLSRLPDGQKRRGSAEIH
jgi:iron(III) transport system permease protein